MGDLILYEGGHPIIIDDLNTLNLRSSNTLSSILKSFNVDSNGVTQSYNGYAVLIDANVNIIVSSTQSGPAYTISIDSGGVYYDNQFYTVDSFDATKFTAIQIGNSFGYSLIFAFPTENTVYSNPESILKDASGNLLDPTIYENTDSHDYTTNNPVHIKRRVDVFQGNSSRTLSGVDDVSKYKAFIYYKDIISLKTLIGRYNSAYNDTSNATSSSVNNKIVKRDSAGLINVTTLNTTNLKLNNVLYKIEQAPVSGAYGYASFTAQEIAQDPITGTDALKITAGLTSLDYLSINAWPDPTVNTSMTDLVTSRFLNYLIRCINNVKSALTDTKTSLTNLVSTVWTTSSPGTLAFNSGYSGSLSSYLNHKTFLGTLYFFSASTFITKTNDSPYNNVIGWISPPPAKSVYYPIIIVGIVTQTICSIDTDGRVFISTSDGGLTSGKNFQFSFT